MKIRAHHGLDVDVIEFEDNGSGIPVEVRHTLFEPLVTTKAKGTGLGLTICQQIIEAHGGTIKVGSGSKSGTCIRIQIPCKQDGEDANEGDVKHDESEVNHSH